MDQYWSRISSKIPNDNTEQYTAYRIAREVIGERRNLRVLDLGCGDGRAIDFFRSLDRDVLYSGVDIESSPEVNSRQIKDERIDTFNGVNMPYQDGTFDVVFCNQVFEHVPDPSALLLDVRRVLKPGGQFVGSVSQIEPYHSFSLWNYTLYGWDRLLESCGLTVTAYRPGIDGVTLTMRSIEGRKQKYARFFEEESPINRRIQRIGLRNGASLRQINHRKIMYAGHLCWIAVRSPDEVVAAAALERRPSARLGTTTET
jgi:SAM-dependent methyltransferase